MQAAGSRWVAPWVMALVAAASAQAQEAPSTAQPLPAVEAVDNTPHLSDAPAPAEPDPAAPAPAAPATPKPDNVPQPVRVLVMDISGVGLEASTTSGLANLIASDLAVLQGIEVISGEDIRRTVDLAVTKSQAGCDDEGCMAEISDALGAEYTVFGKASKVGRTLVVNLSLLHTPEVRVLARVSLQTTDASSLPNELHAHIGELAKPMFAHATDGSVDVLLQKAAQARQAMQLAAGRAPSGFGMALVKTVPSGLMVQMDGKDVGRSPVTVDNVAAGPHVFSTQSGELSDRRTEDVDDGKVLRLTLSPTKPKVKLKVITSPPDANVFVDGQLQGRSPLIIETLAGQHDVVAVLAGHALQVQTLDVKGSSERVEQAAVSLTLPVRPDGVLRCRSGQQEVCAEVAEEGRLLRQPRMRHDALHVLCKGGVGSACAHLAASTVKSSRTRAVRVAHEGCKSSFGPACQLRGALLAGDDKKVRQAQRSIAKFMRQTSHRLDSYAYAPAGHTTPQRDARLALQLCDAGVRDGCVARADAMKARAQQSDGDERRALWVARLDVLKQMCAADDDDCAEFNQEKAWFNENMLSHHQTWLSPLGGLGIGLVAGVLAAGVGGAVFGAVSCDGVFDTGCGQFRRSHFPFAAMTFGLPALFAYFVTYPVVALIGTWIVVDVGPALAVTAISCLLGGAVAAGMTGAALVTALNIGEGSSTSPEATTAGLLIGGAALGGVATSAASTALLLPLFVDPPQEYE